MVAITLSDTKKPGEDQELEGYKIMRVTLGLREKLFQNLTG